MMTMSNQDVSRTSVAGILLAAAVLLVGMAPSPGAAQDVDARWLPWFGCWEAVDGGDEAPLLCVRRFDCPRLPGWRSRKPGRLFFPDPGRHCAPAAPESEWRPGHRSGRTTARPRSDRSVFSPRRKSTHCAFSSPAGLPLIQRNDCKCARDKCQPLPKCPQ